MKPLNPFIITSDYYGPDYFCDRMEETREMLSNILNGRNTVLISERRMGKSGLISHIFAQQEISSNFRSFYVDLYPTSNLSEMVMLMSEEVLWQLKGKGRKMAERFFSFVKSLAPGLKYDPITGQIVFDISLGAITQPKTTLKEIFEYLESSDVPCLVAIDEFQQIADYPEGNVIALLRTYIQKCHKTVFIYSGSKRRMMDKLFTNPGEPFYMSSTPLSLGPIDKGKYLEFSQHHFKAGGKTLSAECFEKIYDIFEGHTWYVQRILNELYGVKQTGETASATDVEPALRHILKLEKRTFDDNMADLPEMQKQVLIAIAKEGKVKEATSSGFVLRHSLRSSSTVQSALTALYSKEYVTKTGGFYSITNRFLRFYLLERYSSGVRL